MEDDELPNGHSPEQAPSPSTSIFAVVAVFAIICASLAAMVLMHMSQGASLYESLLITAASAVCLSLLGYYWFKVPRLVGIMLFALLLQIVHCLVLYDLSQARHMCATGPAETTVGWYFGTSLIFLILVVYARGVVARQKEGQSSDPIRFK